jgi:hypothetical protein
MRGTNIIHETIILTAILCGCETWSITLMEEQRLRRFEDRVLSGGRLDKTA